MKALKLYYQVSGDIPDVEWIEGLPSMEELAPASESPDARVWLRNEAGRGVAHAALWWNETPIIDGCHLGVLGGFAAGDSESARHLLDGAASALREAGCRTAVGPMNGNTWRRHRWVIESDGRGRFLMEPWNAGMDPVWWTDAGFAELSRYSSSVMALDDAGTVPEGLSRRLEKSGVVVRELDPARYDEELRAIHQVCLRSFSRNFLYTPLDEVLFVDAYRKVRDRVDPGLVRIAERDGSVCGFVFCIGDLEAEARGEVPALIVKTLAVDPGARCAGLGSLLVDQVHRIGRERGFSEAIHALQYETNSSRKITGRHAGRVFRRYVLFSKPL